jgi:hypothetical protein
MEELNQSLEFHSPKEEWGRWVETDRPLWCHSLPGEWGRSRMKIDRPLWGHSFDEERG